MGGSRRLQRPSPRRPELRGSELRDDLTNDNFYGRHKDVLEPLPDKGSERGSVKTARVGISDSVLSRPQRTDLREGLGHDKFHQSRKQVHIGEYARE